MGFKSDREFLRNITIGAAGTRQTAELLRQGGFRIIELERASTSNKLWATKVKRLRVPDLLCVRTGIRIESRAKSVLKVAMSHAVNNLQRAWDRGLRDDDLVAFIRCVANEEGRWRAAERVTLFRVRDMQVTVEAAGLTRMKAASEGSEIQLVWPATVPQHSGQVVAVGDEAIETLQDGGRRQRYRLVARRGGGDTVVVHRLYPHVAPGERFGAGDSIIASVMPESVPPVCSSDEQYDFVADLTSPSRETVYAAAKALGFLPKFKRRSIEPLRALAAAHEDALVRLECAAALAKLGVLEAWKSINAAMLPDQEISLRMEAVLIVAEISGPESLRVLTRVAMDEANPSELRAAAAWGMSRIAPSLKATPLLRLTGEDDELVAVHALVAASRLMDDAGAAFALSRIPENDRVAASIVRALLAARVDPLPMTVGALARSKGHTRSWLLYLIGMLGRARCEYYLQAHAPDLLNELEFFWARHVENWTNRLDVADQIDFQLAQVLD